MTLVKATSSQGTLATVGTTVTGTLGTLPNKATATVTFVVRATATGTLTTAAIVTANEDDFPPTNNAAAADLTVVAPGGTADLSVTVTPSATTLAVGEGPDLTYTLTVTNHGPGDATDVVLVDALGSFDTHLGPSQVADFVSATASQGTLVHAVDPVSRVLTLTSHLGGLASGATATVELVVRPQDVFRLREGGNTGQVGGGQHITSSIESIARVAGDQFDPQTQDNKATSACAFFRIPSACGSRRRPCRSRCRQAASWRTRSRCTTTVPPQPGTFW